MWWGVTFALVLVLLTVLLLYARWCQQHWQRMGVYSPPSWLVLGHFLQFMNVGDYFWIYRDKLYKLTRGSKMCGFYELLRPTLSINDIESFNAICIKDFDYFVDRRQIDMGDPLLSEMLTVAKGSHWKSVRSLLSPTFSSGKMKSMFSLVHEKSQKLLNYCDRERDADSVVDLGDAFGKYAMDVIASCAFGMETNSLQGENKEFMEAASTMFRPNIKILLQFILASVCEPLYKLLKLNGRSPALMYLISCMEDTLRRRKEGPRRGDFVDLMLDARAAKEEDDPEAKISKYTLTDNCIMAQSILFILAGFDTTANTMRVTVQLLARHQEEQDALRAELQHIIGQNKESKLTYQDLMEAQYLDAVIAETLRLYPPAHTLERLCTKDYKLPGTNFVIPKGLLVNFPVYSFQRDDRYFPNPEQFQPHRFLPENRKTIPQGAYAPFGLGPRICIAQRFALMEAKLALAELVLKYQVSLAEGFEELKFETRPGIMRPLKGSVKIRVQEVQ